MAVFAGVAPVAVFGIRGLVVGRFISCAWDGIVETKIENPNAIRPVLF
jgi:hypothetical protein